MNTRIGQNKGGNIYQGTVNTSVLFELAIDNANEGKKMRAIDIAKESLFFAKKDNEYTAVYIHCFLAALHIELNKLSTARIHLYNAMNRLDKKHYSYTTDLAYINALQNKLNEMDLETPMVKEALAA